MKKLYTSPEISVYTTDDIFEKLGPIQTQYTTTSIEASITDSIYYNDVHGYSLLSDGGNYALVVGDGGDGPISIIKGFVSFDLTGLEGKTIVSSTLKLYQVAPYGTPYGDSNLGTVIVDHVNFGSSLEANSTNYSNDNYLSSNIGTISSDATVEWKSLETVSDEVQTDLDAGRTTSQFRLRFTNETLIADTWATFEDVDGDGGTTNKPVLEVTY